MEGAFTYLDRIIAATTIELIDRGGTTPKLTFESVAETVADLGRLLSNKDEVIARCKTIQQAEIPEGSAAFQKLFQTFNARYFEGRLPHYTVRVVNDVNFWANEYFCEGHFLCAPSSGYYDDKNRRIFLLHGDSGLVGVLLRVMARAVTDGSHGDEWLAEMRRLNDLGAPVDHSDLEDYLPDREDRKLKLATMRVVTAREVFESNDLRPKFTDDFTSEENSPLVPTHHELEQLVKYWARVHWHNYWVMFVCQQWGSSDTRQAEFAKKRVHAIARILGDAAVARIVEEVKAEMRRGEEDDPRLWDAFINGEDAPEWYVDELVEKALESERNHRESEASQAFVDRRDVPF